jgi:hypothetical protein
MLKSQHGNLAELLVHLFHKPGHVMTYVDSLAEEKL